jgi:DNA-binding beta-propeller fold protein YncE
MQVRRSARNATGTLVAALILPALLPLSAQGRPGAATSRASAAGTAPVAAPVPAAPTYHVYAGAESADKIYRIQFDGRSASVEREIPIGELPAEMEGPHGLAISADGRFLHMTTGHGFPDGKYWQFVLGPDTLAGPGILLGAFPASIDATPDGRYTYSVNFNLHGDMVPSSVSVVHVANLAEVARIVTCTMPHGSRVSPDGRFHYSACMMDDELVEIDTRTQRVSRRFRLARESEGALRADGGEMLQMWVDGARRISNGRTGDPAEVGYAAMAGHHHAMTPATCSPTWAQPSADSRRIYIACNKGDEILEIDRDTWTITRRFATGRGPYNLGVTPDGAMLVASLKQGSQIELFDLASGRSVARLASSTTLAHGVAMSTDSRYAFVTSEGVGAAPGKVDVIDLRSRAKVGTVDIGPQASGIAFWKVTPP